jgi:ferritin-like metal-binding protein YciE
MASDIQEQLVKYLEDAYALEQQSKQLLEKGMDIAGDPDLMQLCHGHLTETEVHERLIKERLEAHGESPSRFKSAAGKGGAVGLGLVAQGSPDTPGKLAAAAYAFEHLEIASYELLKRVAERAGDQETVEAVDRILYEERDASKKIEMMFDTAFERSLEAQEVAG